MVPRGGWGHPLTIGVGVEGASERTFWTKVLHKNFRGIRFDVRNLKNKERLIRATPQLLETFRSLHYSAGFILVDRHRDPCTTAVFDLFDSATRKEARRKVDERYLFICVAIKGLEAWYLADQQAINALLPRAGYVAPEETATLNPKQQLNELWKKQFGRTSAPNKVGFADMIAPRFDPVEGRKRSASFDYFWAHMSDASMASVSTHLGPRGR
ncbi:MAG: DUF4276 family protein [Spirochaetaceae bacterium]|nr:DUF4276 family protein [Spirochaetaceae bacterium]